MVIISYAEHVLGAPKENGKWEVLSKCTSETLHTDDGKRADIFWMPS